MRALLVSLFLGAATVAQAGPPVETRPPNADWQTPAFPEQTRAPGITTATPIDVQTIASGLVTPWSLAFLPNGKFLVTEREGRMRIVGANGSLSPPVVGVPPVVFDGQGGLLDVALSPTYATDNLVYWTYSEARAGGTGVAVARGRLRATGSPRLTNVEVIFRPDTVLNSGGHYGSRLAFAPDGKLLVTLGDRQTTEGRELVQSLDNDVGKVIRINPDGSIPADNPRLGQAGVLPEIFSFGHRNPQGIAIDADGGVWTSEHGTAGGDELNRIRARNFGWPEVTYGEEYDGSAIGEGITQRRGVVQPVYYWDPSIAPAGMTFHGPGLVDEWEGDLFIGALAGQHLIRLQLRRGKVAGEERLLEGRGWRVRDVAFGPDGALHLLTDTGLLVRLAPGAE